MNCWWRESLDKGERRVPLSDAVLCSSHSGIWMGYESAFIATTGKPLGSFEGLLKEAIDRASEVGCS